MSAIKARGETPFPEAGKGVILLFKNSDLKRIEEAFGTTTWFNETVDVILKGTMSMASLEVFLEHGAKDKERNPVTVSIDDLDDVPLSETWDKIFDALCISMRGKSAKDYVTEIFEQFAKAQEDGEIPSFDGPESHTSTNSAGDVTGPASE